MTSLSVTVNPAAIFAGTGIATKQEILSKAASLAAKCYGLDKGDLYSSLVEREKIGTTGFGGSVAIPHAKINSIGECFGVVIRLENPVEFQAHDDRPVDIIFALFSPKTGGAVHLKALAEISRLLRDEDMLAKLRGADNADAIYALLTGQREQQAA
ncbi:MAG: PTS sugar transporter subunit IIA [Parasphingorhabdus sp.]